MDLISNEVVITQLVEKRRTSSLRRVKLNFDRLIRQFQLPSLNNQTGI